MWTQSLAGILPTTARRSDLSVKAINEGMVPFYSNNSFISARVYLANSRLSANQVELRRKRSSFRCIYFARKKKTKESAVFWRFISVPLLRQSRQPVPVAKEMQHRTKVYESFEPRNRGTATLQQLSQHPAPSTQHPRMAIHERF